MNKTLKALHRLIYDWIDQLNIDGHNFANPSTFQTMVVVSVPKDLLMNTSFTKYRTCTIKCKAKNV